MMIINTCQSLDPEVLMSRCALHVHYISILTTLYLWTKMLLAWGINSEIHRYINLYILLVTSNPVVQHVVHCPILVHPIYLVHVLCIPSIFLLLLPLHENSIPWTCSHSGTSTVWTLLGPNRNVLINGVSTFQGSASQHYYTFTCTYTMMVVHNNYDYCQ